MEHWLKFLDMVNYDVFSPFGDFSMKLGVIMPYLIAWTLN